MSADEKAAAQETQPSSAALQVQPQRSIRVVEDLSDLAYILDTARFEHLYRIAEAMAIGSLIPEHIRGKEHRVTVGNCFRVVNQAMRWGMDPWAVIDETYVVKGKLGYQGKLIAAIINSRAGVGGLKAIYNSKTGDDLAIVVYATPRPLDAATLNQLQSYAEHEDREALGRLTALGVLAVRLSIAQGKTEQKMWRSDPEQKLFYSGATKWARRHRPELILGVLSDDDLDQVAMQTIEHLPPAPRAETLEGKLAEKAAAIQGNGSTDKQAAKPQREIGDEPEEEVVHCNDLAYEDFSNDFNGRLAAANADADFQAIGADLMKRHDEFGDERFGKLLTRYQERYRVWKGQTNPAAVKTTILQGDNATAQKRRARADDV